MVFGGVCAGFDNEEGEGKVYNGGGKGEKEVGTGVAVAVGFEVELGECAFEEPEKGQSTHKDCVSVRRRNVVEERFHIRDFSDGFNGCIKLRKNWE